MAPAAPEGATTPSASGSSPALPVSELASEPEPAALPAGMVNADGPDARSLLRSPPEGWTDLRTLPGLRFDVRYHTANNFTEAPILGYGAPGAWLLDGPAATLVAVQQALEAQGLGLVIYDAYRPRRGSASMVAWAKRTGQVVLLDTGYIARVSGHNRGNTVDLGLVQLDSGVPLEMGTEYDTLSEQSHTRNASGLALKNRMILVAAMKAQGWTSYRKEWWHFWLTLPQKPHTRDVPYSCFEAAEGKFKPPEGWDAPGYAMPQAWGPRRCPESAP